jgi:predicted nucleotidyltransferase component of viral defense system
MSMPSRSAAAFRASVRDRLKTEAKKCGRPVKELQREFVLQRFLARVFAAADSPWVLKGGTGLLIRLPGARYSQDLDLLHPSENLEAAIEELKELCHGAGGDPFSFVVGSPVRMSGGVAGVKVKVDTYLGTTLYCPFPIDLSTELPFVAQVERRRPRPVLEVPGIDPLPEFTLYPLPDQVADKVCAMYERHGPTATPSSRFRDLVDLVLIVSNLELDAGQTVQALTAESRRRGLSLPARLETPGPTWVDGYRAVARGTSLVSELHELPAALLAAGACFDPLLARKITTGVWEPQERRWRG